MISPIQKSVVTIAAFDINGQVKTIGSGFFIHRDGTLVTNYHVLEAAYAAEIKTAAGEKYPVISVIAHNQFVDLMKVRVDIPEEIILPLTLSSEVSRIADRVVVIGSPLGLEQTLSEGIVSAVREHPESGKIYQFTAPISQGSSGSPVLNTKGEVIGVVTFQSAKGQNLNFAISIKALQMMPHASKEVSIAEWTLKNSGNDPKLAASLCSQGAKLSIRGKYKAALDYFQKATETNPNDPNAWHGLGSCYIGLDQQDNAIEAFHNSIAVDPEDPSGHLILAMYYKALRQYQQVVVSLLKGIKIDPENLQARFELADAYGNLNQTDDQIQSLKEILEIKPDHVPTLHRMGNTVGRIGRYDEALDLLLKASALEPDNAQIHFDIGVTYHHKKLPEKELRAYTRAIRVNPWMVPAHYNMGRLFLSQGNRKLALHQYEILRNLEKTTADKLFEKIYPSTLGDITAPDVIAP
jgi:tetratricopeptide (TPR) repeat protein